jgi:hypothetical protein
VHHWPAATSPYFHLESTDVNPSDPRLPFRSINPGASIKVKAHVEHALWVKDLRPSGTGQHFLWRIEHQTTSSKSVGIFDDAWPERRGVGKSIPRPGTISAHWMGGAQRPKGTSTPGHVAGAGTRPNQEPTGRQIGGSAARAANWTVGQTTEGLVSSPNTSLLSKVDITKPREARGYADTHEFFAIQRDNPVEQVWCLEVGGGNEPTLGNSVGLILKPTTGQRTFERVGFFLCYSDRWFGSCSEEVVTLV